MQATRVDTSGGFGLTLSARERLDLNISTTFMELAITTLNMWGKEGEQVLQKARGTYAPYKIQNRTGIPLLVWSDIDGNMEAKDQTALKIADSQTTDWRFDDWKTMREVNQCHESPTDNQLKLSIVSTFLPRDNTA